MQKYREYFSKKGWCLPEDLTIPLLQMYNDIFEATPSIDGTSNGGKKESSFKSQNQPINHINRIVIFLQTREMCIKVDCKQCEKVTYGKYAASVYNSIVKGKHFDC